MNERRNLASVLGTMAAGFAAAFAAMAACDAGPATVDAQPQETADAGSCGTCSFEGPLAVEGPIEVEQPLKVVTDEPLDVRTGLVDVRVPICRQWEVFVARDTELEATGDTIDLPGGEVEVRSVPPGWEPVTTHDADNTRRVLFKRCTGWALQGASAED